MKIRTLLLSIAMLSVAAGSTSAQTLAEFAITLPVGATEDGRSIAGELQLPAALERECATSRSEKTLCTELEALSGQPLAYVMHTLFQSGWSRTGAWPIKWASPSLKTSTPAAAGRAARKSEMLRAYDRGGATSSPAGTRERVPELIADAEIYVYTLEASRALELID